MATKERPNGYWKKMSNEDLIHYVRSNHYGDSLKELKKYSGGGYQECRKREFTTEDGRTMKIKDFLVEEGTLVRRVNKKGSWEDIEKGFREAKSFLQIYHQYKNLPGADILERYGFSSLANAITRHYGGFPKFRKQLLKRIVSCSENDLESRSRLGMKENGYWKSWNNVERELNILAKKLGHFPTSSEIKENNRGSMLHFISSNHGGMNKVKERMSYAINKRPNDYWKLWDNVELALKKIIEKLGHFPKGEELDKEGLSSLTCLIPKYHGGMNEARTRMGYEIDIQTKGYWEVQENVLNEAAQFFKEHPEFKFLPSQKKLNELGYSSFSSAICRHHEGLTKFRFLLAKRMGVTLPNKKDSISLLESLLEDHPQGGDK